MKLQFFSYITEQSFKTLPNGERVFYLGFPWPTYVIPDKTTEQRLFNKLIWINRLILGVIIGQPFLYRYVPNIIEKPIWFFAYLFGIFILFCVIISAVFEKDFRELRHTKTSMGFSSFCYDMAMRHSEGELLFGLLGSLAFVAGGVWLLFGKINFYIGLANILFFGIVASGWGYALYLKSRNLKFK